MKNLQFIRSLGGKGNFVFCSLNFKLALWLGVSLALSLTLFREFWTSLPEMLAPSWVFQFHASPWGVLALCLIFIWFKRKRISADSKSRSPGSKFNFALGAGMVAGAVLIPPSLNYMVFRVVLAALGVFVILFGQGARIPAIMVAIYGFVITFPIVLEKLAGDAYAYSALAPLLWLGNGLGYGIQNHGQWIAFTSARGELISAAVTISCAGSATMGIFIALFALMMLDRPLPRQRAIVLFLFGAIGTWLQNIIRLVILIVAGYYLGNAALWTAHYWTIYILFPVWYLLFTFIYFRQFKKPGAGGKQPGELEFKMAMGR